MTIYQFVREAIDRANYYIDQGFDAKGNKINFPTAYMNKTIKNAKAEYVRLYK